MILPLFSSLYENREIDFSEKDWKQALVQVLQFDLAPQLFYLIQQQGRASDIPSYVMDNLKPRAIFTCIQNGWLRAETESVIDELSRWGIPVIALKGTRFAETYFGHFGARRTGDIDLLVPENRFAEAEACLKENGFALTDNYHSLHYHVEYSKVLPDSGVVVEVELHKSILRQHRSKIDIQRFWEEAVPAGHGSQGMQLTLQQTMYEICLHSSKHFMSRYRYVLDVAHLIYRYGDQVDYDQLLARAKEDGTFGMVTAALSTVYKLFPGLKQLRPLPPSVRRIPWYSEQVILDTEQLRKGIRYYFHLFVYPLLTSDGFKPVYLYLKYSLFPPRDQTEKELNARNRLSSPLLYAKLYGKRYGTWLSHRKIRANKRRQQKFKDETNGIEVR